MATRLKPGMTMNIDSPLLNVDGDPVTLIRFHRGGWVHETRLYHNPGWVCQFDNGRHYVFPRRFLAVNRYDAKGNEPPDPHRHDWFFNLPFVKARREGRT